MKLFLLFVAALILGVIIYFCAAGSKPHGFSQYLSFKYQASYQSSQNNELSFLLPIGFKNNYTFSRNVPSRIYNYGDFGILVIKPADQSGILKLSFDIANQNIPSIVSRGVLAKAIGKLNCSSLGDNLSVDESNQDFLKFLLVGEKKDVSKKDRVCQYLLHHVPNDAYYVDGFVSMTSNEIKGMENNKIQPWLLINLGGQWVVTRVNHYDEALDAGRLVMFPSNNISFDDTVIKGLGYKVWQL